MSQVCQFLKEQGLVGSALDHRSLPPDFESRRGISVGCFIFDIASLPLDVARPT